MGTIKFLLIVVAVFFSSGAYASPKPAYIWIKMSDGFLRTSYSFANANGDRTSVYAFQIEPRKNRIDVLVAPDETAGTTAEGLARQSKASLVINGGFFTPDHKSIGLIVKDSLQLNPLHKTSWWSIFALSDDKPSIYAPKDYKNAKAVKTALQVGPRLVLNGQIPKLKDGFAQRSAVGITQDGKVIIAITVGAGISMTELAHLMNASRFEGGLECPNAMALDGGSSSQLYAKFKKFELSLPNIARITSAIAVFAK